MKDKTLFDIILALTRPSIKSIYYIYYIYLLYKNVIILTYDLPDKALRNIWSIKPYYKYLTDKSYYKYLTDKTGFNKHLIWQHCHDMIKYMYSLHLCISSVLTYTKTHSGNMSVNTSKCLILFCKRSYCYNIIEYEYFCVKMFCDAAWFETAAWLYKFKYNLVHLCKAGKEENVDMKF